MTALTGGLGQKRQALAHPRKIALDFRHKHAQRGKPSLLRQVDWGLNFACVALVPVTRAGSLNSKPWLTLLKGDNPGFSCPGNEMISQRKLQDSEGSRR